MIQKVKRASVDVAVVRLVRNIWIWRNSTLLTAAS